MQGTMKRAAKGEGYGNVFLEEVPIPEIGPREVLVKNRISLISRGSEILRRYRLETSVDPGIMGYAMAGTVVDVGAEAAQEGYRTGHRVYATAPHAQYWKVPIDVLNGAMYVRPLPDWLTWEQAPFVGLASAAVAWQMASRAKPGDTVVVLGQGLIGSLVMQAHRALGAGRVIAVDALDIRVRLARELGAEEVIHAGQVDAVAEVLRLTDGRGADVVVDCVGGPPGLQSFQNALEMVETHGIVHQIGLYHPGPLQLDSKKMQRKMLIGGAHQIKDMRGPHGRALELVAQGKIRSDPLITHRIPWQRTPEAFELMDKRIDSAVGVLLEWE